jgi:predicted TIM-barrel fold metal-dependent hydrolase
MNVDDMVLVSIDDHIIEPPDMFDNHLPARFKDRAPKLVRTPDGKDQWQWEGNTVGMSGLGAVASWPLTEYGMEPTGLAEMRPGCYDIHARVRDMDANGVFASMNFPTFAGFNGASLAAIQDVDLRNAVIRAYNDWHIDEWAGAYPGRMLPQAIGSLWDVDALVEEVNRVAKKGCKAITMPETPYGLGLPTFRSGHWDPFFAALCDNDMVMCQHIGGAFNLLTQPEGYPADHLIILAPQLSALTATDLIVGEVFHRFPSLKVALSEGGIGWIPFFLDRLDRHMHNHQWTGLAAANDTRTGTELFRDHFIGCFITDPSALRIRDRIGIETLAWECDFPHSDSTWPESPEMLMNEFVGAGVTDEEIDLITWKNVERFFGLDLFAHVPRDQATVGALRAKATDVDVAETSKHEWRRRYEAALSNA